MVDENQLRSKCHSTVADEAAAYVVLNADSAEPVLLLCDHASARIPRALADLGLDAAARNSHLAVDIGAEELTRKLATTLGTTAVLAGYSRLVVDCNRDLMDPQAFLDFGDGIEVPGNHGLTETQKNERAEHFYWPYHRAVASQIARLKALGEPPVLLAIHSFTPVFGGMARPWDVGVLWRADARVASYLINGMRQAGLVVGDNQPYSAKVMALNNTLERHAAANGLPHACIEVRQDLLAREDDVNRMAATLRDLVDAMPVPIRTNSSVRSVANDREPEIDDNPDTVETRISQARDP